MYFTTHIDIPFLQDFAALKPDEFSNDYDVWKSVYQFLKEKTNLSCLGKAEELITLPKFMQRILLDASARQTPSFSFVDKIESKSVYEWRLGTTTQGVIPQEVLQFWKTFGMPKVWQIKPQNGDLKDWKDLPTLSPFVSDIVIVDGYMFERSNYQKNIALLLQAIIDKSEAKVFRICLIGNRKNQSDATKIQAQIIKALSGEQIYLSVILADDKKYKLDLHDRYIYLDLGHLNSGHGFECFMEEEIKLKTELRYFAYLGNEKEFKVGTDRLSEVSEIIQNTMPQIGKCIYKAVEELPRLLQHNT